ncbi:MAG: DUF4058 family protein [Planctomycetaceae bacterium]|nr:DUF4058 family protein [Planctomycetaceae bacterium]
MPLLDHFHPPLYPQRTWEGLHNSWASSLAAALNASLPERYFAEFEVHWGSGIEIDVATFEDESLSRIVRDDTGGGTATLVAPTAKIWRPPQAEMSIPFVFPDHIEVLVYNPARSARPVAAIELVSPSNKDRPETREAFVTKCAAYLQRRMGVVILDVVTDRQANLHNELVDLLHAPDTCRIAANLYSVSYRPVKTKEVERIDIWPSALEVGKPMPVVPLALDNSLFVPVDLEATYKEACARIRLPV